MKQRCRFFRNLMLAAIASVALMADAAPAWEKVGGVATEVSDASSSDNLEVKVVDNMIVLTLSQATNVKLFTILGQLVAEKQLEAGTWRFPLSARGIYILKAGSATRRITI